MVNYFRDFINGLSSHLISSHLISLNSPRKRCHTKRFSKDSGSKRCVFWIKDLLVNASQLVIMNENEPLVLYADASTISVGGVLVQEQKEWNRNTNHIHLSHRVGSSNEMGYHGARVVCFRFLRQYEILSSYTLSLGGGWCGVRQDSDDFRVFHMSKTKVST